MKASLTGFLLLLSLAWPLPSLGHQAHNEQRLPVIGPAPEFSLISQDGARVSLASYKGKVLAVTFIYTSCTDTCPMLTDKMTRVQDELGANFGKTIAFASITVDPTRDTPAILKKYAEMFGINPTGWTFLTGTPAEIFDVERRYGVFSSPAADGTIDHTFLTSLIDAQGALRVQYIGYRFDHEEFRDDLLNLVEEQK